MDGVRAAPVCHQPLCAKKQTSRVCRMPGRQTAASGPNPTSQRIRRHRRGRTLSQPRRTATAAPTSCCRAGPSPVRSPSAGAPACRTRGRLRGADGDRGAAPLIASIGALFFLCSSVASGMKSGIWPGAATESRILVLGLPETSKKHRAQRVLQPDRPIPERYWTTISSGLGATVAETVSGVTHTPSRFWNWAAIQYVAPGTSVEGSFNVQCC